MEATGIPPLIEQYSYRCAPSSRFPPRTARPHGRGCRVDHYTAVMFGGESTSPVRRELLRIHRAKRKVSRHRSLQCIEQTCTSEEVNGRAMRFVSMAVNSCPKAFLARTGRRHQFQLCARCSALGNSSLPLHDAGEDHLGAESPRRSYLDQP